jgi:hypothetical protein
MEAEGSVLYILRGVSHSFRCSFDDHDGVQKLSAGRIESSRDCCRCGAESLKDFTVGVVAKALMRRLDTETIKRLESILLVVGIIRYKAKI